MQLTRILREGFIAGLIGAGAVALWFLVVDIIAGRPFFTPAMLGSAVFFGETDPSKAVIAFSRVVPYTMIHVSFGVRRPWRQGPRISVVAKLIRRTRR